jgi:TMEM175 potassium channel family protein
VPQSKGAVMSKHRMEIFSDGVFAIVITLLILDVRPPDVEHFTFAALSKVAHNIFAFTLSFVIVGMYWVAHHNMALFLKAVDRSLLWLNLVLLLTIVFLPFSTAVLGQHLGDPQAVMLYGLNIFLVNAAGAAFWLYAGSRRELRIEGISTAFAFKWAGRHAIPNFTSVLGIAFAPWLPRVSLAFYALMPMFFIFPNPITNRFLQGSQSRAHAENAETPSDVTEPGASSGNV